MDSTSQQQHGRKRRLVLCFDGTGNKFLGNESDTNIVKIYELLKRDDPNQFHYYQPGIGTYVENQSGNSSSGSLWTRIKSSLVTTIDQAIGTSFVNHVLAGYRFIMRYYNEGDLIYIFGFSRGAYTARFLAEMLFSVGLLSRGNEEMVRFAWNTFSDFQCSRYNEPKSKKDIDRIEYMKKFKDTFCRENVGVHFLGLFDCVNSVGQFEIPLMRKSYKYIASPPAKYIRHAISIHERRLKFKPALFLMDNLEPVHGVDTENSDVRECWFAGNHGDVGGGWGLGKRQRQLLSDTPLEWMLGELQTVPKDEQLAIAKWSAAQDSASITKYSTEPCETVDRNQPSNFEIRRTTNQPHDMLAFGKGATWFQTLQWWIIEILPFTRLELVNGKWVARSWPPNFGTPRDIPIGANIHPTVDAMYRAGVLSLEQMPKVGGKQVAQLPEPVEALSAWAQQREERTQAAEEAKKRNQVGGKDEATPLIGKSNGVTAKCWDNVGYVTAKSWNGNQ